MKHAIKAIVGTVMVAGIGFAAWCCGPKLPAPELVPTCPGEKFEVCAPGDDSGVGPHDCYCPPE